jgi:hypothetical protein
MSTITKKTIDKENTASISLSKDSSNKGLVPTATEQDEMRIKLEEFKRKRELQKFQAKIQQKRSNGNLSAPVPPSAATAATKVEVKREPSLVVNNSVASKSPSSIVGSHTSVSASVGVLRPKPVQPFVEAASTSSAPSPSAFPVHETSTSLTSTAASATGGLNFGKPAGSKPAAASKPAVAKSHSNNLSHRSAAVSKQPSSTTAPSINNIKTLSSSPHYTFPINSISQQPAASTSSSFDKLFIDSEPLQSSPKRKIAFDAEEATLEAKMKDLSFKDMMQHRVETKELV